MASNPETATDGKIISDMSACLPADALGRETSGRKWCLVDYQTDSFNGVMLLATPYNDVPEIRLPLNTEGLHDIYLGIYYTDVTMGLTQEIALKLSGEPAFQWVGKDFFYPKDGIKRDIGHEDLPEVFWRSADLTNRDLLIGPTREGKMAGLAYIKLVPCNGKPEQNPADESGKRLIAIFDGIWPDLYENELSFREVVEPFRNTNVGLLLWGFAWPDVCGYDSKIGRLINTDCFSGSPFFRRTAENILRLHDKGIDPLKSAVEAAHDVGLQIYGSMRMIGTHTPPAHKAPATLLDEHPEYRCVDETGVPTPHLSLAYPAVREKFTAVLKEMAQLGMDGVHVLFCRSWPYVLYEEITVRDFIDKHGRDPRTLPKDDPDWIAHQCSYVTEFIRQIRRAADEVGQQQGRRIGTAYHVRNCVANCLYRGLDVETWMKEGLVDVLIPTWDWDVTVDSPVPRHDVWDESMAEFVRAAEGASCRICPDAIWKRQLAEKIIEQAIPLYRAGADGLCYWDTNDTTCRCSEWAIRRELGHIDKLEEWLSQERGKNYFRLIRVTKLMDFGLGPYTFTNG